MLAAFLHSYTLVESTQDERHIFTLGAQYGQTPYRFGDNGAAGFLRHACDLGLFDRAPPPGDPACFVANLDGRKMRDDVIAHLIFDFDGTAPTAAVPDFDAFSQEVIDVLRAHIVDSADHDFSCAITGCQPEDKAGAWSVHVHFPRIMMGETPSKELLVALNQLPSVRLLNLKADRSIYTNGIRFGNCSKPLKNGAGWRRARMQLLLGDSFESTFPLHDTNDVELLYETAVWIQQQQQRQQQRAPAVAADHSRAEQALAVYRKFLDRDARIQPTGVLELADGRLRINFVDSAHHTCVHRGNNHYGDVEGRTLTVYCGGGQELLASFALPPPADDELDDRDYVRTLATWLDARPYTSVAVAFTAAEYQTLDAEPDHPLCLPPGAPRALCIDVNTFNALVAAGASHDVLAKYINLGVTLVCSTQVWHCKGPDGHVRTASHAFVTRTLSNFLVPNDKDKLVPFLPLAERSSKWTVSATLEYYRPLDPAPGDRLLVLRNINPDDSANHHGTVVALWWRLFMQVLVYNSVCATDSLRDIRPLLSPWVQDWVLETLFGYQPVGLCLTLIEPTGGAGKSLLAAIMTNILGAHQQQGFNNLATFLNTGFNYEAMHKRLFVFDDGSAGSKDLSALKQFITQHHASTNIKYGTNGLSVPFSGVLLWLSNQLDPAIASSSFTTRERRFLFVSPDRCYPYLLQELEEYERMDAITHFGQTHEEFLSFGYEVLAQDTEQARALCGAMLELYLTRLEEEDSRSLAHCLRARIEDQSLLTTLREDAARNALGPLGGWIMDALEAGLFFDAGTTRGVLTAKYYEYCGPERAVNTDNKSFPAHLHVPSLRALFTAEPASRNQDAADLSSVSAFKTAFIRAFNMITRGTNAKSSASRCRAEEYVYGLNGKWERTSPDTSRPGNWVTISFPAAEAMVVDDENEVE